MPVWQSKCHAEGKMAINLNVLRGTSVGDAQKGDLFFGRAASDPQFLVGTLNDAFKVVVNFTSGKFDISPVETVEMRRGLVARNAQFFVHLDDRQPIKLVDEPDALLGVLVISGDRVGLLAQNLRHESLHFVSLINDQIGDDAGDVVAFLDWAICVQDAAGVWNKLYEFGPGKAAAGLERL
jgi:hypothetical protein